MDLSNIKAIQRQQQGLAVTDPASVWYDDPADYIKNSEQTTEKDIAFLFGGLFNFLSIIED